MRSAVMSMTSDRASKNWYALVCLALAGIAALAIRLYKLDAESLWMDELVTVQTYYLSPWQLVLKAADEGQPPLENLIGGVLARLGLADSDWWVRFPAAVFGAGGVALLGWWVRRHWGWTAGIGAAILLGVCPLHVYMSQEARPYALCFLLALLTVVTYERARAKVTAGAWYIFGAAFFLLLMVRWVDPHVLACGILGFAALTLLRRWWGRSQDGRPFIEERRAFAWTCMVMGIAYTLYAPFFLIVLARNFRAITAQSGDWILRWGNQLIEFFAALFWGYSTRMPFSAVPGSWVVLAIAAVWTVAGLAVLCMSRMRPEHVRASVAGVALAAFPVIYATVYTCLGNAIPKPQYLLIGAAPVLGMIAVGANSIRERLARWSPAASWTAFLVVLASVGVPMVRATTHGFVTVDKRDWRGLMGYLRTHASAEDAFAVCGSDTVPPSFHVAAYGQWRYGPQQAKFLRIDLGARAADLLASPWTGRGGRVWIVVYRDRMYVGDDHVPPPESDSSSLRVHTFSGLFLVEVEGEADRTAGLWKGLNVVVQSLPARRSLVAPAILGARYEILVGNVRGAEDWGKHALRQCRSVEEAAIVKRDYLSALGLTSLGGDPLDELQLAGGDDAHSQ